LSSLSAQNVEDLTDFYFFTEIVEYGGITSASRALGIPKSRLSRRLAALEERYAVQLIHRSSRLFTITNLGQIFYDRCKEMVESSLTARALVNQAQTQLKGLVRVSAGPTLADYWLAPLLPKFLGLYPDLQIELDSRDPHLDLVADRIDLAIRVRPTPLDDSDLIVRHLRTSSNILVAAPALLAQRAPAALPEDLLNFPLLGMQANQGQAAWPLQHKGGGTHTLQFSPRLTAYNLVVLREAAIAGLGVALLPPHFCNEQITAGLLKPALPNWAGPSADVHAAYLSRRGLSAGARALLDFLILELPRCDDA
jgi:DNA-binding transcriptional LysR family regulator